VNVLCSPARKLPGSSLVLMNIRLNFNERAPAWARQEQVALPIGWMGVVLRGWSICDWKSSLTRAISCRGRAA
jgi:hypothetical protein